jgi:glyoxylase-like metal-dependent hydrolase (beta-lactamase superfamily II)
MKITEDLFWYSKNKPFKHFFFHGFSCNIFALRQSPKDVWLFDVGTNQLGRPKRIMRWMKKDGLNPSNISKIFITHAHPDHINALKFFKKILNPEIIVHELEKEMMINGYNKFFMDIQESGKNYKLEKQLLPINKIFLKIITNYSMGKMPNIQPDKIFSDGCKFQGEKYTVITIHMPGHTIGHSCFWIKELYALITGDLFDTSMDNKPSLNFSYTDYDAYSNSLQRIKEINPYYFLSMHGNKMYDNKENNNLIQNLIDSAIIHLKEEEDKIIDFLKQKGDKGAFLSEFKELYRIGAYYDIGDYKGFAFSTLKSLIKRNMVRIVDKKFYFNL